MNYLNQVIVWLDGRKIIIGGCVSVVVGYLASVGAIDTNLSTAILAILNILLGGVKIYGDTAVKSNTELGQAIKQKRIN